MSKCWDASERQIPWGRDRKIASFLTCVAKSVPDLGTQAVLLSNFFLVSENIPHREHKILPELPRSLPLLLQEQQCECLSKPRHTFGYKL